MVIIQKPHYDFYSESSIMGEWKPLISLVAHHNWMTSSNFSFPMALTRESLNITFCSAHFTKSCFKFQSIQDHTHLYMDFFIYGRNCCQFFLYDFPTWGGNLGPKLHPGGGFFGPWPVIILKNSHQDLSNEGSNFILSSLEVGHWVAQT